MPSALLRRSCSLTWSLCCEQWPPLAAISSTAFAWSLTATSSLAGPIWALPSLAALSVSLQRSFCSSAPDSAFSTLLLSSSSLPLSWPLSSASPSACPFPTISSSMSSLPMELRLRYNVTSVVFCFKAAANALAPLRITATTSMEAALLPISNCAISQLSASSRAWSRPLATSWRKPPEYATTTKINKETMGGSFRSVAQTISWILWGLPALSSLECVNTFAVFKQLQCAQSIITPLEVTTTHWRSLSTSPRPGSSCQETPKP